MLDKIPKEWFVRSACKHKESVFHSVLKVSIATYWRFIILYYTTTVRTHLEKHDTTGTNDHGSDDYD